LFQFWAAFVDYSFLAVHLHLGGLKLERAGLNKLLMVGYPYYT
jgi:hypothetical protein